MAWALGANRTLSPGDMARQALGGTPKGDSRGLTAAALSCSYNLSCELEPPSESASNTLKAKKNMAIVKRWSE